MHAETYFGINEFLIETSKLLLKYGVKRKTRGEISYELPEPVIFKISNPLNRIITIPERKWVKALPYAESLWIASGRNDLNFISHYLKNMENFSDDGEFIRAGYGPRYRYYSGLMDDYKADLISIRQENTVDQLKYVIECFKADSSTRRAVISLSDPMKDDFYNGKLKITKDYPCTRELHFIKQATSNKLDLIVKMRANDLIWGASAVNIFNYTFIQEYVSVLLGLEIGAYYHIVDNLHYYEHHKELLEKLIQIHEFEECPIYTKKTFSSLNEFDKLLFKLCQKEDTLRKRKDDLREEEFEDEFFQNWYHELYLFNLKRKKN